MTTTPYSFMNKALRVHKDSRSLLWGVMELANICSEADWKSNELYLCFEKHKIQRFERDLCTLSDNDLERLDYDTKDAAGKDITLKISIRGKNSLRILIHFWNHMMIR